MDSSIPQYKYENLIRLCKEMKYVHNLGALTRQCYPLFVYRFVDREAHCSYQKTSSIDGWYKFSLPKSHLILFLFLDNNKRSCHKTRNHRTCINVQDMSFSMYQIFRFIAQPFDIYGSGTFDTQTHPHIRYPCPSLCMWDNYISPFLKNIFYKD